MPLKQIPSHPRGVRNSPGAPGWWSWIAVLMASIKAVTKGPGWLISRRTYGETTERL
jgi:hypothetical protein